MRQILYVCGLRYRWDPLLSMKQFCALYATLPRTEERINCDHQNVCPMSQCMLTYHNLWAQAKSGVRKNNCSWWLQSWDNWTRRRSSQAQAGGRFGGEEGSNNFFITAYNCQKEFLDLKDFAKLEGKPLYDRCTHPRACQKQGWTSLEELAGCTGGATLGIMGTLLMLWGKLADRWTLLL